MSEDLEARVRAEARAARAERMARDGAQAMADHKAAVRVVDERTNRLRALRLAKEAEDAKEAEAAKVAEAAAPRPTRKRKTAAKT